MVKKMKQWFTQTAMRSVYGEAQTAGGSVYGGAQTAG